MNAPWPKFDAAFLDHLNIGDASKILHKGVLDVLRIRFEEVKGENGRCVAFICFLRIESTYAYDD